MAGKLFKYLPKPTSFSVPTTTTSAAAHKAAFSGPINISIVPKEARRNKKEPDFSEPTSPKVSCIGTIKNKHCKIKKTKKEKINKSKSEKVDQEPVKEKKASTMKSMFSRKVRAAAAAKEDVVVGVPPAIGAMRRFRSGRESLGDFDWRNLEVERREEEEDDDDEVLVPHSAPILMGGGVAAEVAAVKRKKEVELWRRRTLVPPKSLEEGVMATHDEETRKFFKHSSVICVLAPRYGSNKLSIIKQRVVGTLFTHHQKCVMVDTQAHRNYRKITAFLGGLDLCDGRYDTPEHRLFSDLTTVFANDFHNPTFPTETKGPRQPWHDLHCRLEGPAAYDVLTNFEQRWKKATKWRELGWRFKKKTNWSDDSLLKLERISWILSPKPGIPEDHPSLRVTEEENPEHWHVQVFRSIDSGSVKGKGFSKMLSESQKPPRLGKARRLAIMVEEAKKMNLVCQKNLVVDQSIHKAYVKAIRSAEHFIYIENQYFLGSSYAWPDYKNAGADNLVPIELALKVASKIRAQEKFAVYVIIPMWPEGAPTGASVQEILFWQAQTIQMMYTIIGQEIKSMNMVDAHPQDYLNFFCLGNREELPKESSQPTDQPSEKTAAALCQKYRRFMIYVHAKGMIVDDEYVILGSANINQRSLSGTRDTEIAMGAYQPHYTWAEEEKHPRGQVYGYRMSLWAEHLGMVDGRFKEPNDLECVRFVNKVAEENWINFTAEELRPLTGHLLKYPIKVEADGKVGPLPGYECFPDVGGKILGSPTSLPDTLTL